MVSGMERRGGELGKGWYLHGMGRRGCELRKGWHLEWEGEDVN